MPSCTRRASLIVFVSLMPMAAWAAEAGRCGALERANIPSVSVESAEGVAAGALNLPSKDIDTSGLPAFCRVVGTIKPRPNSEIHFETWLPDHWNGRYLQAGNGGFAGSIAYPGLIAGVKNGFAVTNSDGGHRSVDADMSWALASQEAVEDFGNRALFETAKMSKGMVAAFYGKPAHHAYFSGCSDGGREALMSAQRYPDQFDGWAVGAPENDFTRELTSELVLTQAQRVAGKKITSADLKLLGEAARKTCDSTDGAEDGVVADPMACHVDVDALACTAGQTQNCLAADVLASIKAAYKGVGASDSHPAFSGFAMVKGAEDDPGGWATWMSDVDGKGLGWHEPYAQEYFGTYIYQNKALDLTSLDPGKAYADAQAKAGRFVDAVDPDLSKQRAAGKKILQFHGWSDTGIPVAASIDYYKAVQAKLGGDVSDFYRLFLAPGVGHCGGGPGPNRFGQAADAATPFEPSRHVLAALVAWVEDGKAPDGLRATKYLNDDPNGAVVRQGLVCPYPETSHYKGSGSSDKADTFECR